MGKISELQRADSLVRQHYRDVILDAVDELAVHGDQPRGKAVGDLLAPYGVQGSGFNRAVERTQFRRIEHAQRGLANRVAEDVEQPLVHIISLVENIGTHTRGVARPRYGSGAPWRGRRAGTRAARVQ